MKEDSQREWITLKELQRELGIGSTKAYGLVSSGEIPAVRVGRSIRVSRRTLNEWLARHAYTA